MTGLNGAIVWMPTLLLVSLRLAGMMLFAPVLGDSAVPVKSRLLLGVVMGVAVVSRLARPVAMPDSLYDLAMGGACEVLIGVAIGFAGRAIFLGVELGAMHIGTQMGLALAEVSDPSMPEASSAVGGLLRLVAVVVFLAIGGHRALLGGLLATFDAVPPLAFPPTGALLATVVAMLGAAFVLALKLAAPALIAVLISMVAMGLLQRTSPQFNLFSTGLPLQAMLGLLVLAGTMGVLGPLMDTAAAGLTRGLQTLTTVAR
jgi:flagellar biosynthetic protein FliR